MDINFILGFVRSGSTMLMGLCREHPDIETDVVEPNFLYQLLEKTYLPAHMYPSIGISETAIAAIFNKAIASCTRTYYEGVCVRTGKQDVVIKHPYLTKHIYRLSGIFPEAKFLVLVRHPYDVIASTFDFAQKQESAAKIFGKDLSKIIQMYGNWMAGIDRALGDRKVIMKFEDLLDDPVKFLDKTFKFFGKTLDLDAIHNIIKLANENRLSLVGSALGSSVIRRPGSKFETLFQEPGKNLIRMHMRPFVKAFGYEER